MDDEIITRLARVEAKLDLVIPHVDTIKEIEADISFEKKIMGLLTAGGGGGGVCPIRAQYDLNKINQNNFKLLLGETNEKLSG
jgi:hypothetical protein